MGLIQLPLFYPFIQLDVQPLGLQRPKRKHIAHQWLSAARALIQCTFTRVRLCPITRVALEALRGPPALQGPCPKSRELVESPGSCIIVHKLGMLLNSAKAKWVFPHQAGLERSPRQGPLFPPKHQVPELLANESQRWPSFKATRTVSAFSAPPAHLNMFAQIFSHNENCPLQRFPKARA